MIKIDPSFIKECCKKWSRKNMDSRNDACKEWLRKHNISAFLLGCNFPGYGCEKPYEANILPFQCVFPIIFFVLSALEMLISAFLYAEFGDFIKMHAIFYTNVVFLTVYTAMLYSFVRLPRIRLNKYGESSEKFVPVILMSIAMMIQLFLCTAGYNCYVKYENFAKPLRSSYSEEVIHSAYREVMLTQLKEQRENNKKHVSEIVQKHEAKE